MAIETKTILVTGGAGYVGSTLIRDALADGYYVRCLDHLVYGGKAIVGFMNHPNFEFIQGDIRDKNCVNQCLNDIDYVIHLAAIVGDKPCQVAPKSTYQINYFGTELIAKLSKKAKVKKFIFSSRNNRASYNLCIFKKFIFFFVFNKITIDFPIWIIWITS